ncbi:MAG TPA: Uma2 family endonuclease [Acidimicrobiales bacterium]
MAMTDARMTAEDYFVATAGDRRTQLIDGAVVVNEPKWRHQRAAGLIFTRLQVWTETQSGRGVAGMPIDIVVDRYNVFAPDVWWVADATRLDPDEFFRGVPDLAVEVRSPSTWRYDVGAKKARYEQHGLPELWLVDTAASTVLVLRRWSTASSRFDVRVDLAAGESATSPQLPGFVLALDDVFAAS